MDRQMDRGLTERQTVPECMVLVAQPHTPVFVQGPGLDLKACLAISAERPSTLHASKQGGPLLGKVVFHGEKLQEGHMDGRGKAGDTYLPSRVSQIDLVISVWQITQPDHPHARGQLFGTQLCPSRAFSAWLIPLLLTRLDGF